MGLLQALACGRTPDAEQAPTIRLLARLGDIDAGEIPAAEEAPVASRTGRVVRPRERKHLARVALGGVDGEGEERLALLAPAESTLRFPLAESGSAVLRLGVGLATASEAKESMPVSAVIRLVVGDDKLILSETELTTPTWVDLETDLTLPGGAVLELTSRGPAESWIAWSSPELVGAPEPGWDLILISLDTLRADHLGSYGYSRPTSPRLDELAAEGFLFERAYSSAPWTLPSHESLFNGLYPVSHGELRSPPLAKRLWQEGYRAEAWTGGGMMDYRVGTLAQGFDIYRQHDWIRDLDALEQELAKSSGRRRFLLLHTYEPHDPYIDARFTRELPAGRLQGYFDKNLFERIRDTITNDEKRYVEALYDGDIAYTDEQLGTLFDVLRAGGVFERSIVVVTSDHGEQFWEHGSWRHGQNLYDEQLHVPLILWVPDGLRSQRSLTGPRSIALPVRLIDLYPTLLDLMGFEPLRPVQGRSLVPLLQGEEMSEIEALAEQLNLSSTFAKALRFRGFKLIHTRFATSESPFERRELYDLRRDPGELTNVFETRPEIAAELRTLLQRQLGGAWAAAEESLDTDDLDSDLRRDLEALGYIGN